MRQLPAFFCLFLALTVLSCESTDKDIIDTSDPPPILLQAGLSPTTVNTDTINIGPERLPDDLLSIQLRVQAKFAHAAGEDRPLLPSFSILRNRRDAPLLTAPLADGGMGPDLIAGDSVFTALVTLQIPRSTIGLFYGEVWAEDSRGSRSNAALLPFSIIRLNQPPQLSNLQAPDTVKTSTQSQFFISVKAVDPDGQGDIRSVTRTTPSGMVLQLTTPPGDSIYAETVSLVPAPPPGSYQFSFKAMDRSNAPSTIIYRTIVVIL